MRNLIKKGGPEKVEILKLLHILIGLRLPRVELIMTKLHNQQARVADGCEYFNSNATGT
jgi:hypothetical protein